MKLVHLFRKDPNQCQALGTFANHTGSPEEDEDECEGCAVLGPGVEAGEGGVLSQPEAAARVAEDEDPWEEADALQHVLYPIWHGHYVCFWK